MKKNKPDESQKEVLAFFQAHDIEYRACNQVAGAYAAYWVKCVNPDHNNDEAKVIIWNTGKTVYKCHHDSCNEKTWNDYKRHYVPDMKPVSRVATGSKPKQELPPFVCVHEAIQNPPELAEELIHGILRKKRIMLLSAPSKAGKTMLLINLAACISEGLRWMDSYTCSKGRVLYVNMEIDADEMTHRFIDVYKALGYESEHTSANLTLWNLRGIEVDMEQLTAELLQRVSPGDYVAVIIDPFYSVMQGDENSAQDVSKFCREILKLSEELKTSVVYCHHHSKGGGAYTNSMNRASGSGVFARNADAIIDMTEIEPKDVGKTLEDGQRLYRISGTVRSFPEFPDFEVIYKYPLHTKADGFKAAKPVSGCLDPSTNGKRGARKKQETANTQREMLISSIKLKSTQTMFVDEAAQITGKAKRTIYDWFRDVDGITIEKGIIRLDPLPKAEEFEQTSVNFEEI